MGSYPVLEDILNRRTPHAGGGLALQFIELYGANLVPMQHYEPEAGSFRHDFYYNTRQNVLYRKLHADGKVVWKRISE